MINRAAKPSGLSWGVSRTHHAAIPGTTPANRRPPLPDLQLPGSSAVSPVGACCKHLRTLARSHAAEVSISRLRLRGNAGACPSARFRTGNPPAFYGNRSTETIRIQAASREPFLAAPLLRSQHLFVGRARGEVAIHPSESCRQRAGQPSKGLCVVELQRSLDESARSRIDRDRLAGRPCRAAKYTAPGCPMINRRAKPEGLSWGVSLVSRPAALSNPTIASRSA